MARCFAPVIIVAGDDRTVRSNGADYYAEIDGPLFRARERFPKGSW
jgi:hypothetical protein